MSERLYKWLLEDGTTPTQHIEWPVKVGEWTPWCAPVLCESGWHGMFEKDVLAHLPKVDRPPRLFEVEAYGDWVKGADKFVCSWMRLMREVGRADTVTLVKFALVCAESSLKNYEATYPNDGRIRNCIDVTWHFMAGTATKNELDAAEYAAGSARAAAWSAEYAAGSAEYAARSARAAAWSAEYAAGSAEYAARYAARSAGSAAESAAWSAFKEEASRLLITMIEEASR